MDDIPASILITVINTLTSGAVSAELKDESGVTFQLSHGKIKMRVVNNRLTGSFSSTKQIGRDIRNTSRVWHTADLGTIILPESDQNVSIVIQDIPYEILVFGARGHCDSTELLRYLISPRSVEEWFTPHPHGRECADACPMGTWSA